MLSKHLRDLLRSFKLLKMGNILKTLFGKNTVESGAHIPENGTHATKQRYTSDLLKIRRKARIIEREARDIKRLVDTATQIAIATGGYKK